MADNKLNIGVTTTVEEGINPAIPSLPAQSRERRLGATMGEEEAKAFFKDLKEVFEKHGMEELGGTGSYSVKIQPSAEFKAVAGFKL